MNKEQIFNVIKDVIIEVLGDEIDKSLITMDISLKDLGANSIDRVDILLMSMERMNIKIKMMEFSNITNINGIVELLFKKINE